MSQVPVDRLHVLVKPEHAETLPAALSTLGPYTLRNSTTSFDVSYDNSLGTTGQNLADAVLGRCEQDLQQLTTWFGGVAAGRFALFIDPGSFGAYHASCAATELHLAAFDGSNGDLVNMLNVAEVDEVFMAVQNAGWDCGASHGEGLSRVLSAERYPAQLDGFASASAWLDTSNRPDWVSNTEATDRNYVSIGCAALFINYLHYQLDYSLTAIVAAAAPTLAQVYTNLTSRTDAFAAFSALVEQRFPIGAPSGLTDDNPFPIPPSAATAA